MKKVIPEKLFNLQAFEKVCPAKNPVPLANFDIEIFMQRQNTIIHIDDEPYPFDVEFNGSLEYCGKENSCRLYKIPFSAQKNDMVFAVNKDNSISRIMISGDVNNPASIEAFAAVVTIILRNVGMNVEEIQAVNKLIQNNSNDVFSWCAEAERFILLDACTVENLCYIGFFAAVE